MRVTLALSLALATSTWFLGRASEVEPPLLLTLEIDGRELQLQDGERAQLEVGGKQVALRVQVSPTRRFVGGGVSFEFPRAMSFAHESDGVAELWTLDGDDCIVHVHAYTAGEPEELLGIYLAAVRDAMSPQAQDPAPIEFNLGGTLHAGRRLEVDFAGHRQHFSGAALRAGQRTVLVVVQDADPQRRRPSAEARQLLELLGSTFQVEP